MNEHVFMCFYLMSILSYASHVLIEENSAQSVDLYCPSSSLNQLHTYDFFTQQNKCPSLHGHESVTSSLGLFLWQQRGKENTRC